VDRGAHAAEPAPTDYRSYCVFRCSSLLGCRERVLDFHDTPPVTAGYLHHACASATYMPTSRGRHPPGNQRHDPRRDPRHAA